MVVFKGFEVFIQADGVTLQEYEDAESTAAQQENTVVRHVECVTGADFTIHFRAVDRDFAQTTIAGVRVDTFVDGSDTTNPQSRWKSPYEGVITGAKSRQAGQCFLHKFNFQQLDLDDGEIPTGTSVDELAKEARSWGTLEVQVYRLSGWTKCRSSNKDYGKLASGKGATVNEKILKGRAVSHKIQYGDAVPYGSKSSRFKTATASKKIDRLGEPFLCYKFNYMSKPGLQSIGLIPRSPSPIPLEERDTQELSREEMMALIELQRGRLQTQVRIKQEHTGASSPSPVPSGPKRKRDDQDSDELSLVEERSVRSCKITHEPIDLTDD